MSKHELKIYVDKEEISKIIDVSDDITKVIEIDDEITIIFTDSRHIEVWFADGTDVYDDADFECYEHDIEYGDTLHFKYEEFSLEKYLK